MNPLLYGLTPLYAGAVALRNAAFDAGFSKVHTISCPVVSIGNITAGGSGKTPVVAYTASLLIEEQYRTAIVSRGYKRSTRGTVVVADGGGPLVDADRGGDEPVMLALHTPDAAVIADEDRVRGCLLAADRYAAQAIVLDDAYQHRRCARDFNVLVYDVSTLPHEQRILPAGRLREPLRNVARADFILLSRCDSMERATAVMKELKIYTDAPYAALRFTPVCARPLGSMETVNLESLQHNSAYAFCGIGKPESFKQTLTESGIQQAGFRAFPDHYRYTVDDLQQLQIAAKQAGAEYLVTTEKDAVRLRSMASIREALPVYSIMMGIEFLSGERDYRDALLQSVRDVA